MAQQSAVAHWARGGARWAVDRLTGAVGGPARRQVIVLLACVLALDSANLGAVGAVAGPLETSLHINNAQLGLLASINLLVGAVFTLPVGALTDRVRRTRLLTGSIIVWSLAMIASAAAPSFGWLLVSRVVLGAVTATAGPVVASLTGDLFPAGERGRIYGFILSGELLGTGIGYVVSGDLSALWTWRAAFGALAIPGFILAVVLHKLLPEPARGGQSWLRPGARRIVSADAVDPPDDTVAGGPRREDTDAGGPQREDTDAGGPQREETDAGGPQREDTVAQELVRERHLRPDPDLVLRRDPTRMPLWSAVRYVLAIRTNVYLIVASALGYFFFAGLQTYAVLYLRGHYGLGAAASTALLPLLGLGALSGVLFGGRFADRQVGRGRLNARLVVAAAGYLATAVLFVPALLTSSLLVAIPIYFVAAAALGAPNPPLDAARLDIMPPRLWGRAEAVRTALRNLAEALAPLLFGLLSVALGGPAGGTAGGRTGVGGFTQTGASSARGLQYTFLIMLLPLAASSLMMLRARRSYGRDVATAEASVEAVNAIRAGVPAGRSGG